MESFLLRQTSRLQTDRGREELLEDLQGLIGEKDRPFHGRVTGETFTISQITGYRSSFLPRMSGLCVVRGPGTDIELKMRPSREVIFFLLIWYAFLFLFAALVVLFALQSSPGRLLLLLVPLGLGGMTGLLSARVFESDCHWSLEAFKKHVPCRPSPADQGERGAEG